MEDLSRAKIDTALDDLIANQRAVDFQRLAMQLARQKWPDIIASELSHDGGEDGFTILPLSQAGKGISVACSLTATKAKILSDCTRIKERQIQVDLLVFYTPRILRRLTWEPWQKEVNKDFHHDLQIISREDIAEILLQPHNAWMCKRYLNIQISEQDSIDALKNRAKDAAKRILEGWKREFGFDIARSIGLDIQLSLPGRGNKRKIIRLEDLSSLLKDCHQIHLRGVPGAGKSHTLIQLAESFLRANEDLLPLLISLPEWASHGEDLISFIAGSPALMSQRLSKMDLARLADSSHLIFLMNGWNEIPEKQISDMELRLGKMLREIPACSFVISTRERSIAPPRIPGSLVAELQPLSRPQRRQFVSLNCGDHENKLINRLEQEPILDEVSKTPLFLQAMIKSWTRDKTLPDSRYLLLEALIQDAEESPEHQTAINSGITSLYHRKYLCHIAAAMCKTGGAVLGLDDARVAVTECGAELINAKKISIPPDSLKVVDLLTEHHLLKRSSSEPVTIQFVHQEFQDWFAAEYLFDRQIALHEEDEGEAIRSLQFQFINWPAWESSILLHADRLKHLFEDDLSSAIASKLASNLVESSIPIDLVFTGWLINILQGVCKQESYQAFISRVSQLWERANGDIEKEYILAAMLASETAEFADILWPLIEDNDEQVRWGTYRILEPFPTACLGGRWIDRVSRWDEDRRREFIHEVCFRGGAEAVVIASGFAEIDPSISVRAAAIDALVWGGAPTAAIGLLGKIGDEVFDTEDGAHLPTLLPSDLIKPLISRIKAAYEKITNPEFRTEVIELLLKLNDPEGLKYLKHWIEQEGLERISWSLLEEAATVDPEWIATTVGQSILDGNEIKHHQTGILKDLPTAFKDQIGDIVLDENVPMDLIRKRIYIFGKFLTKRIVSKMLSRFVDCQIQIEKSKAKDRDKDKVKYAQDLGYIIRELNRATVFEVIMQEYHRPDEEIQLRVVVDLACSLRSQRDDEPPIPEITREKFRECILEWAEKCRKVSDKSGGLNAHIVALIGSFGDSKDLSLVEVLVEKEVKRGENARQVRKEWAKSKRNVPVPGHLTHSWSNYYVDPLIRLGGAASESVLTKLIDDDWFQELAAVGLVNVLVPDIVDKLDMPFWGTINWEKVMEVRAERNFILSAKHSERQERVIQVLSAKLERFYDEMQSADNKRTFTYRISRLLQPFSIVAKEDHLKLIIKLVSITDEDDPWSVARTFQTLLLRDFTLTVPDFGSIIVRVAQQLLSPKRYSDQGRELGFGYLALLFMLDDPSIATDFVRDKLSPSMRSSYQMRSVLNVIAQAPHPDCIKLLLELEHDADHYRKEWIKALGKSQESLASQKLIKLLYIADLKPSIGSSQRDEMDALVEALFEQSKRSDEFKRNLYKRCETATGSRERRILASVLERIGSEEAAIAACYLLRDKSPNRVPFGWRNPINRVFVSEVPVEEFKGAYDIVPRACNIVRQKLFELAMGDEERCISAAKTLLRIEIDRKGHGRPPGEPRHPMIESGVEWPFIQ